jgi:DNA modification methylase
LIIDLVDYLKPRSIFDPMEGSGTTREVCLDLNIAYEGRDLRTGFDVLSDPLPDKAFDLIFWHPPYWPGFRYSLHPNDFSSATNEEAYLDRLQSGFVRLRNVIAPHGHLAILIGDGRKNGRFYALHDVVIRWGLLPLVAILIKEGDHARRARHFRYGPSRFIPTLHEYVLLFRGEMP